MVLKMPTVLKVLVLQLPKVPKVLTVVRGRD